MANFSVNASSPACRSLFMDVEKRAFSLFASTSDCNRRAHLAKMERNDHNAVLFYDEVGDRLGFAACLPAGNLDQLTLDNSIWVDSFYRISACLHGRENGSKSGTALAAGANDFATADEPGCRFNDLATTTIFNAEQSHT